MRLDIMARRDDQFGLGALQVRAPISDDAVRALGEITAASDRQ